MPRLGRTIRSGPFTIVGVAAACSLHDEPVTKRSQASTHARVDDSTPLPVPIDTIMPPDKTGTLVAGSIPAHVDVTSTGEATYTIPLWVPPGRAGIQPTLALEYHSRGGNGLLGVGWSLTGLSQITRCVQSVAVDGAAGPVKLDATDAYCLDGQRLIRVIGAPPVNGTERWGFRTERDSLSRIIATMDTAKGPTHFTIYEKSGLIREYDGFNTAGTGAVINWLLTSVADHYGNTMRIIYGGDLGYAYPKQIDYTSSTTNPSLTANRSVAFTYEPRAGASDIEFSAAGARVQLGQRMNGVVMSGPDASMVKTVLRKYTLSYAKSMSNGRSLLVNVASADGSDNALSSTDFTYEPGTPGYTAWDSYISDAATDYPGFRLIDIDGDGASDLIYMSKDANGQPELVAQLWDPPNFRFKNQKGSELHIGGQKDLFNTWNAPTPVYTYPTVASILVWMSLAGTPTPVVQELSAFSDGSVYPNTYTPLQPAYATPFFADFDGDGLSDALLSWTFAGPPLIQHFELHPNTGVRPATFGPGVNIPLPQNWAPGADIAFGVKLPYRAVDFDGDGAQELPTCLADGAPTSNTLLLTNILARTSYMLSCADAATHTPIFVDINGDGLDDVIYPDYGQGTMFGLMTILNPGPTAGFAADGAPDFLNPLGTKLTGSVRAIDYDLDGHSDLISTITNASSVVSVSPSRVSNKGITFDRSQAVGPDVNGNQSPNLLEVGDLNGDGLQDYVLYNNNTFTVYLRNGNQPDMMTKAVDGFGAQTTFLYKPISDSESYTSQPLSNAFYPLRIVKSGIWVVRQHSVSNGTAKGALTTYYHKYADGLEDVKGRGFLGFNQHEVIWYPPGAMSYKRDEFDNGVRWGDKLPFVGMPTRETTATIQGGVVQHERVVDRTWDKTYDSDFYTYFPYARVTTISDSDDDYGTLAETYRRTVTVTGMDHYGNVTGATFQEGNDEWRTIAISYQYANAPSWFVDHPTKLVETSLFNNQSVTRTRAYRYDANGGLEWEVIEPNVDGSGNITPLPQPQADGVASRFIHYQRDPDGQINTVTEDSDFAATPKQRVSSYFYDGADRTFPTRMRNKLGHMVHVAYHPGLGVLAAVQDANGIYSRWRYDSFGRLKRAEPGDGEPTWASYVGYAGLGENDPNGTPKPSLEIDVQGDAGGAAVEQIDYVGQSVLSKRSERNDGRWTVVERQFDEWRNLASVSRPRFAGATGKTLDVYTHDGMNRVTRIDYADGRQNAYVYYGPRIDTYDADPASADAIKRTVTRDKSGRVGGIVELAKAKDGRPERGLPVYYSYSNFGTVGDVINTDRQITTRVYDRLGRTLWSFDPSLGRKDYGYNIFGEVETVTINNTTSSMPEVRSTQYDDLGRALALATRDGTTTWTWDTGLNGVGKLASVVSADGVTTAIDYDAHGDVAESRWTVDGETFAVGQEGDVYGRLSRILYPAVNGQRFEVRYDYGAHGALQSIRNGNDATSEAYWTRLETDAAGTPTNPSGNFAQFQLGGTKIAVHDVEDSTRPGFLQAIQSTGAGGTIQSLTYAFDAKGNLQTRRDELRSFYETFEYDELNRLGRWKTTAASGQATERFDYDNVGNLKARTFEAGNGSNVTYGYDQVRGAGPYAVTSLNGLVYGYDGEGNQTQRPDFNSTFNVAGLPTAMNPGSSDAPAFVFGYDGFGARVRKQASQRDFLGGLRTSTTLSVGGLYYRNTATATPTTHTYNIAGPEGVFAQVVAAAAGTQQPAVYILHDHLGSADTLVDAGGAVIEARKFDPFGAQIDSGRPDQRCGAFARFGAIRLHRPRARLGSQPHQHEGPFLRPAARALPVAGSVRRGGGDGGRAQSLRLRAQQPGDTARSERLRPGLGRRYRGRRVAASRPHPRRTDGRHAEPDAAAFDRAATGAWRPLAAAVERGRCRQPAYRGVECRVAFHVHQRGAHRGSGAQAPVHLQIC